MAQELTEQPEGLAPNEETVRDMLILAGRLRESSGGELDDAAIMAVAEATGTTADYVRIALRAQPDQAAGQVRVSAFRKFLLAFDPDVRRWVVGSVIGSAIGLLAAIAAKYGDPFALIGILSIVFIAAATYNCGLSKDARTATIAGALTGAVGFAAHSVFLALMSVFGPTPRVETAALLIPISLGSALAGLISYRILGANRARLGIKDPVAQRQELLRQLVEIQDKLKSHQQVVTFMSVDVVGSTKLKAISEPLAVEYTFNEYHAYVEGIARKYGGRIHATAGDGVICAFETADSAFRAGRNLQAALIEFNTHRNRLARPIELRVGIHTGQVLGEDVQTVNFTHVIDIAAHLEKVCPVGGVAVSDASASQIAGGPASIGSERVAAQGIAATVWLPRISSAPATPAPPPLPSDSSSPPASPA